jgi:putative ABC transport system permease protein
MIRHLLKIVWNRKRMNALIMSEIFFSFLVVFSIATLGLYLLDNYRKPVGFSYENVWNVRMELKGTGDDALTGEQMDLFARLLRETQSMDGVVVVAGAQDIPYDGSTSRTVRELDGRRIRIVIGEVTDSFADVLDLDLVAGRWFEEGDAVHAWLPVVINRKLARDLFGDEDPVGKLMPFEDDPPQKIIGLVSDYRKHGEFTAPVNFLFRRVGIGDPGARPPRNLVFKVQPGADAALEETLLARLQALARDFTFELRILEELRETSRRLILAPLLVGTMVAAFLMIMVGLGLIGVLWQNVTQRTREIGLRRATGAHGGQIRRQILGELWILTALGLVLGVILVVQLPLLDLVGFLPATVFWTGMGLAVVAIYALATVSGVYPAWLATRIQPAEALHYE